MIGKILLAIYRMITGRDLMDDIETLEHEIKLLKEINDVLIKSKVAIPEEVQAIIEKVTELCRQAEESGRSGGFKRASVVAQMRREGVKERDIALAIELAVRGMNG